MEYILGLRNRQRYVTNTNNIFENKFLSEKYDPHEILVYSTSINRTLLSMTSQLQGLYPNNFKSGETLDQKQLNFSKPSMDISCKEIDEELDRLENSSLPNYMTMIPIHMISGFEKKINVFDYADCKPIVAKILEKNEKESKDVINITNFFNEKYGKIFNKFYDRKEDFKYEFENISKICDTFIADYIDRRNITQFFEKTNINNTNDKEEFLEECKNAIGINFKEILYGDNEMEVLSLEESMVLKEMLHYMKIRVNTDINKEKLNISDYSKPKMVIISGHDTSLTAQILFLIKIFKLDNKIYKLPTYSAQVAIEVTRNKNNIDEKLRYSDYSVRAYFNDDLFLNVKMDEFIKTVEENIWSQERIDSFCYGKKNEGLKLNYYIIIIISISIIVVGLLIVIIILINKIKNKNEDSNFSFDSDNLINED